MHGFLVRPASGHCSRGEIEEIVKAVKPKMLFPVHTEHPEMFRGLVSQVYENIKLREQYEI
jgi:mRNA degradation ribonuclease J1/J2